MHKKQIYIIAAVSAVLGIIGAIVFKVISNDK